MKKCVLFSIVLTVNFCHVSTIFCAAEDVDAQGNVQDALIKRMPFVSVGDKIRLIITKESSPARVPDQYVKPVALGMYMKDKLIPKKLKEVASGMLGCFDPQVWQEVEEFVGGEIKYSDCKLHTIAGHVYSLKDIGMSRDGEAQVDVWREHGHKMLEHKFVKKADDGGKLNLFVLDDYKISFSNCIAAQLIPDMDEKAAAWNNEMFLTGLCCENAGAWLKSLKKIQKRVRPINWSS